MNLSYYNDTDNYIRKVFFRALLALFIANNKDFLSSILVNPNLDLIETSKGHFIRWKCFKTDSNINLAYLYRQLKHMQIALNASRYRVVNDWTNTRDKYQEKLMGMQEKLAIVEDRLNNSNWCPYNSDSEYSRDIDRQAYYTKECQKISNTIFKYNRLLFCNDVYVRHILRYKDSLYFELVCV